MPMPAPVKAEVYRVAGRHGLKVFVVANSFIAVPRDAMNANGSSSKSSPDAADDWIAGAARRPSAIVITTDVPAGRPQHQGRRPP